MAWNVVDELVAEKCQIILSKSSVIHPIQMVVLSLSVGCRFLTYNGAPNMSKVV